MISPSACRRWQPDRAANPAQQHRCYTMARTMIGCGNLQATFPDRSSVGALSASIGLRQRASSYRMFDINGGTKGSYRGIELLTGLASDGAGLMLRRRRSSPKAWHPARVSAVARKWQGLPRQVFGRRRSMRLDEVARAPARSSTASSAFVSIILGAATPTSSSVGMAPLPALPGVRAWRPRSWPRLPRARLGYSIWSERCCSLGRELAASPRDDCAADRSGTKGLSPQTR